MTTKHNRRQWVDKKELYRIFKKGGRWTKLYTRIKFKICPLLAVEPHFPKSGTVVDLGCGNGLFAAILKLGSPTRQILGFDLDEKKIRMAHETFDPWTGLKFQTGNIVEMDYPEADVYSLIDVLYLMPIAAQDIIFKKCRAALKPGGVLIIKDMDVRPRWKYAWNMLQEILAVKIIGFTLGGKFHFRSREDYVKTLERIGFRVDVVALDKGYWYPHILYVCKKI